MLSSKKLAPVFVQISWGVAFERNTESHMITGEIKNKVDQILHQLEALESEILQDLVELKRMLK